MTAPQANKLSVKEMMAYGCGDFASVLYWTTFMKYLTYFYTDVFGLPVAVAGAFLFWSRSLDGVSDVAVGIWADRNESRWGKFRPFLIWGCLPFAIAGVLTFTTPGFIEGDMGKLIWAIVTYNFLMVMYTIVNIPYTALMGVMTDDSVVRTRLSSVKFIFAFSAGVVISFALLPMVAALGGAHNPQLGWQLAFVIVGLVAIGFFLITGFNTRERIHPKVDESSSLFKDFGNLLSNQPWVVLLCTTLTWILFIALRSSIAPHYFKYYIYHGSEETTLSFLGHDFNFTYLMSTFNGLGQLASVLGVVVVLVIANRFPKRLMFISLLTMQIACTFAYLFLQPGQIGMIFILEIVGNFVGAPLPVLMWAMYADTADHGEWKSGRRTTALVFSASTMSQKFGWGIAAWLALSILDFSGFVANTVPTAEVTQSLVRLMSIIPSAFGVLAIIIFLFYTLNESKMSEIKRDLDQRRIADSA
jgi:GPH family glycoside/pentoside/hexuronide:cation symporter